MHISKYSRNLSIDQIFSIPLVFPSHFRPTKHSFSILRDTTPNRAVEPAAGAWRVPLCNIYPVPVVRQARRRRAAGTHYNVYCVRVIVQSTVRFLNTFHWRAATLSSRRPARSKHYRTRFGALYPLSAINGTLCPKTAPQPPPGDENIFQREPLNGSLYSRPLVSTCFYATERFFIFFFFAYN